MTVVPGDAPFVGLQPYGADQQHLFRGRKRDAKLLYNKLFSRALTLLYAPSGVGKTSLLTGALIPRLRSQQGEDAVDVVYFEDWEAEDLLPELKRKIAGDPPNDTPDDRPGVDAAAPLAKLLQDLRSTRKRDLVVILDQFEQVLLRRPETLLALGVELGGALRLAPGCHFLISLREEFLGGLEPLREHVPTLMASTFRLEYLAGASAAEAIREPVEMFGASVDDDLLQALLNDLKADSEPSLDAAAPPQLGAIELPFLQLVCSRLWERSDRRHLTLALYRDQLGGRDGIMQDYLRQVVAALADDQTLAAELMQHLAPRSGLKKLYLASELVAPPKLDAAAVARIVGTFEQHKILRMRSTSKGVGYELYHDAFVKILRPWIDQCLADARQREQRWRWARNGVVTLAVLGVLVLPLVSLWRDRARVEGQVAALQGLPPAQREAAAAATWSEVSAYLWAKGRESDIARLIQLLREHRKTVPHELDGDAMIAALIPDARFSAPSEEAPVGPPRHVRGVTILVHPDRPLEVRSMFYVWRTAVLGPLSRLGLPMVPEFELRRDHRLGANEVSIEVRTDERGGAVTLDVPVRADWPIVLDADLDRDTRAGQALKTLGADEKLPFEGFEARGWYVPPWTAPMWKAAGIRPLPPEYVIANAFLQKLRSDPELLLDRKVLDALIERERARFCDTVDEAEAARGGRERLRQDLIEVARLGYPLRGLASLLDRLAARPAEIASPAAAREVTSGDPQRFDTLVPTKHERTKSCEDQRASVGQDPGDYQIRVRVPESLRALGEGLRARQREWRETLYRQRGVVVPEVRLDLAEAGSIGAYQAQILLPGESPQPDQTTSLGGEQPAHELDKALRQRLEGGLRQMVMAETVERALQALPERRVVKEGREVKEGLAVKIRAMYTVTDLKFILRGVVQDPASGPMPQARTLAQLPWLLGALVYWTATCESRNQACLVQGLRETQRSRLQAPPGAMPPKERDPLGVDAGMDAVLQGELDQAHKMFHDAHAKDAAAADARFLAVWPTHARTVQGAQLTQASLTDEPCQALAAADAPQQLTPMRLQTQLEIEDYMAGNQPGGDDAIDDLPSLQLCLLRAALGDGDGERAYGYWRRLRASGVDPARWSADHQFNAGMALLLGLDRHLLPDESLGEVRQLLAASLLRLDRDTRRLASTKVFDVCRNAGTQTWCTGLLQELHRVDPDDNPLAMNIALQLGWGGTRADAAEALRLYGVLESRLQDMDASDRERTLHWIWYGRASAFVRSVDLGDPDLKLQDAEGYLRALLDVLPKGKDSDPLRPQRGEVWQSLVGLLTMQGRDAGDELAGWRQESGESEQLQQQRAFALLARADRAGLVEFAASEKGKRDARLDERYAALVAALVTAKVDGEMLRISRDFLYGPHQYRDYLLMTLHWNQGATDETRALLAKRWGAIDPKTWDARLARGDVSAWRERLIGYFLGKLGREELFRDLPENEDQAAFDRGSLARLGEGYRSLLSEAYFYEALRQASDGEAATRLERCLPALQRVVTIKQRSTWEFNMARYLLNRVPPSAAPG